MDVWVALVVGLGSGVVGAAVAAVGTAWVAFNRDRDEDARRLRDRKADRLRAAFKPVLHIAGAWEEVVRQQGFLMSNETEEQRDARLSKQLEIAGEGLIDAQIALTLEPGIGHDIHELFRKVHGAYVAYQVDIGLRKDLRDQQAPGQVLPHSKVVENEKALKAAVEELVAAMTAAMDEVSRPLPAKRSSRVRLPF